MKGEEAPVLIADAQSGRHAGLVRHSPGPHDEEKTVAGKDRSADGRECPNHGIRRVRLGTEPNNIAAVNSLIGYRALRFGKNVEVILTDQRSFR